MSRLARTAQRVAGRWAVRSAATGTQRQTPTRPSLVRCARDAGWKVDRPTRAFLGTLGGLLRKRHTGKVSVLVDGDSSPLAELITVAFPKFQVFVLSTTLSDSAIHTRLAANGRFDVLIDDTMGATDRVALWRNWFFHVAQGGAYLVRNFQASSDHEEVPSAQDTIWLFMSRLIANRDQRIIETRDWGAQHQHTAPAELRLAKAIGKVVLEEEHLLITNRVCALAKMREAEIEDAFEHRPGELGKVLEKQGSLEFRSRSTLREHSGQRDHRHAETFRVPPTSLREYYNVVCVPRQIVIQHNLLLPDTFRHHLYMHLVNICTNDLSDYFAHLAQDVSHPTLLKGPFFHLDSEWPGHFGHAMTEQLSRLWAWDEAKRAEPDLKALLSMPKGRHALNAFEIDLFAAAGIDKGDLVAIECPVRVEKLLAATPMLSMPNYVHPGISELWTKVGRELESSTPTRDFPPRIFCSRRMTYKRGCRNAAEVESLFASHGFDVIYPEDLPLAEQAAVFRNAEVVGGFAGSALFNLLHCESPKRVIMISPESYTTSNEYMIASVRGHEIDRIWCTPDVPQPEGGWAGRAFASAFSFDFDRDGPLLKEILSAL